MARNDGATNGATTGAVVTVSRGSVRLVSSGGAGGTSGTSGAGKERRVEVRGWDGLKGKP